MGRTTDHFEDASSLGDSVQLRPLSADNYSALRYVHESAVRHFAREVLTEDDVSEWSRFVRSPGYTDRVMASCSLGAWYHGQLIGTAGWRPSRDDPDAARITAVYVQPVYANCGVGSRLLDAIEGEAAGAGFKAFSVRSIQNAAGFFQLRGYRISSYGIRVISPRLSIPVTFLRKGWPSAVRTDGSDVETGDAVTGGTDTSTAPAG